ncbi:MAG: glycosyltransferase [Longimicrobiales bacterium]|nr:glycosyltransferase [Longimicrobiales bacterium]
MARNPLVSVVIDNYNYAAYLGEAIESVLAQTYAPTEVIVVDDGSTDGSRDVIAAFGGRVRAVFQPNAGQAAAFNAGVAAAQGDVICFLDSDDMWLPHKVERTVAGFAEHPEAGWLRHRLAVVDASGRPLGAVVPRFRGTRARRPEPLAFIEGCWPVPTSALALRRRVAEKIFPLPLVAEGATGWPAVDLRRDADAFVALQAAALGEPFLSLDETLGSYRRHPHQVYASAGDLAPMLQRQIALGSALGGPFAALLGRHVVPSSVFKHRAVLAGLQGKPLFARERLLPALEGARRILPLLRVGPRLFARQAAGLALATLAPRLWAKRLFWRQGFTQDVEGAGDAP